MWDIAEISAEYCVVKCEIFARKGWDIGEKMVKYEREMSDILREFVSNIDEIFMRTKTDMVEILVRYCWVSEWYNLCIGD